jgi:hypothetical protein
MVVVVAITKQDIPAVVIIIVVLSSLPYVNFVTTPTTAYATSKWCGKK